MQNAILTPEMRRQRELQQSLQDMRNRLLDDFIAGDISVDDLVDLSVSLRRRELET